MVVLVTKEGVVPLLFLCTLIRQNIYTTKPITLWAWLLRFSKATYVFHSKQLIHNKQFTQMKVKLIRTYVKNVEQKDENGLPLVDQFGRVIKQLKDMFLYGIVEATADEKELYRVFRTQDGEDYYREESGVPLYHSNRSFGYEAVLNGYTREDGTVGFSVEDTKVVMLKATLAEVGHLPGMAEMLGAQIALARTTGGQLDLKNLKPDDGPKAPESSAGAKLDGN